MRIKASPRKCSNTSAERQTDQKTDRSGRRLADGALRMCVCLYAPAEPRQSGSTEAKLNGEGRLKAVPGPAASVFNHRSLSPTPPPACWSSRSERSHAPCHSHTQVHTLHTCALRDIRFLARITDSFCFIIPCYSSIFKCDIPQAISCQCCRWRSLKIRSNFVVLWCHEGELSTCQDGYLSHSEGLWTEFATLTCNSGIILCNQLHFELFRMRV